jgi:hypothetical protein
VSHIYGGATAESADRAGPREVSPVERPSPRVWPALDELLTPSDVMAILKVSDVRTARRYMQVAGGFRLGRDYRIRRLALLRWIENRELDTERPQSGARPRASRIRAAADDWRARIRAAAR